MRAQLSIEFLLIAAVFLAVLGLLVPIVVSTYQRMLAHIERYHARAALERIVATADELCVLGGESRREVDIQLPRAVELIANGRNVSIPAIGASRTATCEFHSFAGNTTSRTILLTNEGGRIKIS